MPCKFAIANARQILLYYIVMRLNKYIALATGVSRREADGLIVSGVVAVNGEQAKLGKPVDENAKVAVRGQLVQLPESRTVIVLNKPVGYVCSRNAQAKGVQTVYALLPDKYKKLKTIGRLDKDSSGLIMLTDDGDLAFRLTHPKFAKTKQYLVTIDKALEPLHQQMINDFGINLPDGRSQLRLEKLNDNRREWRVVMHEGRNRQIRRTFAALGYTVIKLHRTDFDNISLSGLKPGKFIELTEAEISHIS